MRNTGKCPKCKGTKIIRIEGDIRPYGAGNNIITGMLSAVRVHRYLCCECGYSEEWIDPKDIPEVKEKYGESYLEQDNVHHEDR